MLSVLKTGGKYFPPVILFTCPKHTSARFVEVNQLYYVFRLHSAEGTVCVTGSNNFVIEPKDEFGRLNDLTAVFPPSAYCVRDIVGHAFSHWEVNFVSNLL